MPINKIVYSAFAFSLITLTACSADNFDQATLKNVVDKLDLTSFANSIGPRRESSKITFRDYGVTNVKLDGKKAELSMPDNSWEFVVTLLNRKDDQIQICFEDHATNGGSYHSQDAYSLKADNSGWLKASSIEADDCLEFTK